MKTLATVFLSCWAAVAADSYFLITYTLGPDVNVQSPTKEQLAGLTGHAQHAVKLMSSGALLAGGHTTDPRNVTGIAVIKAKDAAEAQSMGEDSAVRKGILKMVVQPFNAMRPETSPLVSDARANYDQIAQWVLEAAEKMPTEHYGFRPSSDVRTFAQLLAHIAEAQYIGCGAVLGETYVPRNLEQTVSAKAQVIPALRSAFGYCGPAWTNTSDAAAVEKVALFGRERTKLGALDTGTAHVFEHYGNVVTYMRMQGIVPPSSAK